MKLTIREIYWILKALYMALYTIDTDPATNPYCIQADKHISENISGLIRKFERELEK